MTVSGFLLSDTKESNEYKAPSLLELIKRSKKIRSEYKGKTSSRLELIFLLELIHEIIEQRYLKDKLYSESDLQAACMGCWIFCLESIAQHYKILNPEFGIGSLFNSGSKLYQVMLTQLNIDKHHQISDQIKLEDLNKLYKLIYKEENTISTEEPSIIELLRSKRVKILLKESLIQIMQDVLSRENHSEKRVLKAIPCEKAMDQKIMQLYLEYKRQAKKQNQSRLFLINLAMAICNNNLSEEDPKKIIDCFIPLTQRIKIGCILYIMESIAESYKFPMIHSPKANSVLYKLCDEVLVNCYKYLNDATKLSCLSAFASYINDFNHKKILEEDMNKKFFENNNRCIYIDPEIHVITNNLNRMMKILKPSSPSNVTLAMTGLGALIGAAPGYGAGYGVGYGISLTDQSDLYKKKLSGITRYAMEVLFDEGEYFTFNRYTANILVDATLGRFYAKIFEALAALVCAAGFGTISFIIYDLTYETACDLCKLYLHLSRNINPALLSQTDLKFVNTLLDLPEDVFSARKKEKLRNITNMSKTSVLGFLSAHASEVEKFEIIPIIKQNKEYEEVYISESVDKFRV